MGLFRGKTLWEPPTSVRVMDMRAQLRQGKIIACDRAILYSLSCCGIANRVNIERFVNLQDKVPIRKKTSYEDNIKKLTRFGWLQRGFCEYPDGNKSPYFYRLTTLAKKMLIELLQLEKTHTFPSPVAIDGIHAIQAASALFNGHETSLTFFPDVLDYGQDVGPLLSFQSKIDGHPSVVLVYNLIDLTTLSMLRQLFDRMSLEMLQDDVLCFLVICDDLPAMEMVASYFLTGKINDVSEEDKACCLTAQKGKVFYTFSRALLEADIGPLFYSAEHKDSNITLTRVTL